MHWCMDETLALLSLLPFLGYYFSKVHAWWHSKFHHKCHEEGCASEHPDHSQYSPYDRKDPRNDMTHLSEEDAEKVFGPTWKRAGFDSEEHYQEYLKTKPEGEPPNE